MHIPNAVATLMDF